MPVGFKDTFKLWQVIKNLNDIFDGGSEGQVLTRGATEFDSSWGGEPAFAEMHCQGNTTETTISNSDEWTQVTAGWTGGVVKNGSFSTDELVLDLAGDYQVTVALSMIGVAATTWTVSIAIDDTPQEPSRIERKTAAADVGALAITGIFTLSAGATVQLYVKNQTLTGNPTITEATMIANRI